MMFFHTKYFTVVVFIENENMQLKTSIASKDIKQSLQPLRNMLYVVLAFDN